MPGSVGQFFLRNWLLKLAAVFFAVMLYVAVAAQQPLTETFALRLSVAPPPGRALRQAPPSIAVTVQGKGSEILKLRNIPRTISKAVPDTLTGSVWRLHLSPADVTLPKGVEGVLVSDISPRDVDIVVDSAARRDVRIVPRVTLEKDSGFALLGITVVPPTARLIGPPKSLAGVESVTTQPTQIPSVPGPVYRTVALDTQALRPGPHRNNGPRHPRLRGLEAQGRAPWLRSSSASRPRATRPQRPCSWASAPGPSSRASSSCRRTCTRCSAASCRNWRAARTSPRCPPWSSARSMRRASAGARWTPSP